MGKVNILFLASPSMKTSAKAALENIHLMLELTVCGVQNLAADYYGFIGNIGWDVQVQCHVGKGGLETNACRYIHVEDEFLQRLFNLIVAEIIVADEWCQVRVKIRERPVHLRTRLQGIEKNLRSVPGRS
jgi:hypothetical protein